MSNARFSILQSRAVADERISNAQFRTLAALGTHGDKDGYCFPKLKTLGDLLGKSKQAVSKDLQALSELGYVEITPQYRKDGSRMGNLYRLLFDTPRQPDVDPHKWDDDTHQPQMLTPVSSQVDAPSTSEVDALTTHINDPSNDPSEEERLAAEIFQRLEIMAGGSLNTNTVNTVNEWMKHYPSEWIDEALGIAEDNGASSPNYVTKVLENWFQNGKAGRGKRNNRAKSSGILSADEILAIIEASKENGDD